jgi:hypothetical protein
MPTSAFPTCRQSSSSSNRPKSISGKKKIKKNNGIDNKIKKQHKKYSGIIRRSRQPRFRLPARRSRTCNRAFFGAFGFPK